MKKFPFYKQKDQKDCGPTCLKIISKYHKKNIGIQKIRNVAETNREGTSLNGLSDASESLGFRSLGIKTSLNVLLKEKPLPCILHWNNAHYVVLYKLSKTKAYISDPAVGLLTYNHRELLNLWISESSDENTEEGIALLVEPTPKLYTQDSDDEDGRFNLRFVSRYLREYKKLFLQVFIGLFCASILQVIFPFLTQSIVDVGIQNQDLDFIYLILIAQLFLFFGRTAIEVIRSWSLLHINVRLNISLISDFFIKLMNLPISFFDIKMTGDILQRINDHKRIEKILTVSTFSIIFSLFNILVFGIILFYYSIKIFAIFLIGSVLYFLWIALFLEKRKKLDYKRFSQVSTEQSKVIELINGMQEIKLHNAEKQKRWSWENVQAKLFKISVKSLTLEQFQSVGSNFINEIKNILIVFVAATLVIDGELTLGMMMAVTYIVGQLDAPVTQIIRFIKELQDAKISLDRLSEIHNMNDEKFIDKDKRDQVDVGSEIIIRNLKFKYPSSFKYVLNELDLSIPSNKVTAIVGVSGGGKTTLLKILLKFYEPESGQILIGNTDLNSIKQSAWRDICGVVMQEGYIFNDTIANNIAVGESNVNLADLKRAVDVANIKDYIEKLPLGYNTQIGMEGMGLSTGQKQRILIARAIYKNPKFILFDEATSSLDTENERSIVSKLNEFFKNKTVLVIAHRLSTVKDADKIVVLENGLIVEEGSHEILIAKKGRYFDLVRDQLNA